MNSLTVKSHDVVKSAMLQPYDLTITYEIWM